MNRRTPRVSVGMPVYNAAAYLREALDSALSQTYSDFELVISDNASTDETESICREYAARDPRIRYERLPQNLGAVANFNRLVARTSGEYFRWAAGDDVCAPTYLEEMVRILDTRPEVVWCHAQSGKIDQFGNVLSVDDAAAEGLAHTTQAGLPRRYYDSPSRHRRFRGVLLGTTWCADAYGLIRRSVLEKTGLYPPCYGAEKVLIGELALHGRYAEVPRTLFFQRVHGGTAGQLRTEAEQLAYVIARPKKPFTSTRFVLLREHARAVRRVAMPGWDRVRCHLVIGEYLLQYHKWFRVARAMLKGGAVGRESNRRTPPSKATPAEGRGDRNRRYRVPT